MRLPANLPNRSLVYAGVAWVSVIALAIFSLGNIVLVVLVAVGATAG